ncbi:hypothetical protein NKR23_g8652 [Pleurostoma richardsiae]|uniref:Uncharacterized protein n=1 Tax=Pleurostoma richardsiae TaxID=41990 RepID=A0AA38VKR0_9PEZI|nr:hypothetical protein NKR23_g8652 [Pleurostoma richardsiae]
MVASSVGSGAANATRAALSARPALSEARRNISVSGSDQLGIPLPDYRTPPVDSFTLKTSSPAHDPVVSSKTSDQIEAEEDEVFEQRHDEEWYGGGDEEMMVIPSIAQPSTMDEGARAGPRAHEANASLTLGHTDISQLGLWVLDTAVFGGDFEGVFDTPGEGIAFGYYIKHVSGVMSTYDDERNPYRKLSAYAVQSPVVLHTLVAIATQWMLNQGEEPPALHLSDSSNLLSPYEAALAACLFQIAQVIFTGGDTANAHLDCSMFLLGKLNYVSQPVTGFVARFLTQRFAMLDVAWALFHRMRPRAPLTFWLYQISEEVDFTEPCMHEMAGCPQPVLSALAHIAHLASELWERADRRDEILRQGYQLETTLRSWAMQRFPDMLRLPCDLSPNSEEIRLHYPAASRFHLRLLNECFYWLAQLLLQRRIYRDATTSNRVQQTVRIAFSLMKGIPAGSSSASSLPLPFYLIAREAVTVEDRAWVREMHAQMLQSYRATSRRQMMELTEEIWRQSDLRREALGLSQFTTEEEEVDLILLETRDSHFVI